MFHRVRGGTRGGQGLFKWEDVKEDKHRENYLGHSLKASTGRWQNNKDLGWYVKEKDDIKKGVDIDELAEIKQREAEAFAEALGGHVGVRRQDNQVSKDELKKMIKKDFESAESETIVGIGYGKRLLGIDQSSAGNSSFVKSKDLTSQDAAAYTESAERIDQKREDKKEESKKKKEKKKKKKKKDHKEKRRRRGDGSSSDSDVGDNDRDHSSKRRRRRDRSHSRER